MPIVELHLLKGYESEAKSRLGRDLTNAIRMTVPAAPEAITVLIHERDRDQYMRGGTHRDGAPALPDPAALVQCYLKAMEARDLDRARTCLAPGFSMQFPGTAPMHSLDALIDWARPRYRFVTKAYEGIDCAQSETASIVYARGTLSGEWPDGTPFAGIRFIDRFELEGGLITKQEVWNDIAEVKAASQATSGKGTP
ncbi:nuclear transport factor 2 family protein [Cognatishimia sp. F0-27]|uniref:nuclear transport factor 2 family protein n=1 Tax=Cognatishimia sp. F0-27 TaxID=2816855 RepID=UPI001D0C3051|nr:nuclear transport factor 2 family protein [Cognatishimia sp. F0-27]MCC1491257.1 nuclear transport factor 2 family protein [Cognatishimia sp. F0-27]